MKFMARPAGLVGYMCCEGGGVLRRVVVTGMGG